LHKDCYRHMVCRWSYCIMIGAITAGLFGTPAPAASFIEYLVIAGGGGGGWIGGGGGAGGYRCSVSGETSGRNSSAESPFTYTLGNSYTITIGAGGTGATNAVEATIGNNSVFGSVTSIGGGRGGKNNATASIEIGGDGGAGGGAGQDGSNARAGGAGTSAQGFGGGSNAQGIADGGGGGGGAGAVGSNGATTGGGNGGAGIASSITNSSVQRGGGGGGGSTGGIASTASFGGGAGTNSNATGANGTVNTGGGAGAGGYGSGSGGSGGVGGSGVVIIRYPSTNANLSSIGGGLTYTLTTAGGYKIYSFTAGTGLVTV
jgi:hypothetical protein